MQKYLKAQAVADNDRDSQFANVFNQAVLEINPSHTIIKNLRSMQQANPDSPEARETVELVFNTAALAAGYVLDNAADYSQMVVKMMSKMASGGNPGSGAVHSSDHPTVGSSVGTSVGSSVEPSVEPSVESGVASSDEGIDTEVVSGSKVDTEVESGGAIDAEVVE